MITKTLNLYIHAFRSFYNFLNRQETLSHLKLYKVELEDITPSEILSPDEVVAIANEAGKRRELYKILILTLYESCARISEVSHLRLGDVVFGSVTDKEGNRKLIATLHFKRSKRIETPFLFFLSLAVVDSPWNIPFLNI